MLIGWGVAAAIQLSHADRMTFVIEFSARNIAVATIVALSGLERLDLTVFSGAYGAVGYGIVGVAVAFMRRASREPRPPQPSAVVDPSPSETSE